jgi:hypothetical protein
VTYGFSSPLATLIQNANGSWRIASPDGSDTAANTSDILWYHRASGDVVQHVMNNGQPAWELIAKAGRAGRLQGPATLTATEQRTSCGIIRPAEMSVSMS